MSLISFYFILFLGFFAIFYYACPMKMQNMLLVIANILFYLLIDKISAVILFMAILLTYLYGKLICKLTGISKKIFLYVYILICTSFFIAVKIISNTEISGQIFQFIGASFYILQMVSYVIDIYKEKLQPQISIIDYLIYIMFFPKIIAGPILNTDFISELNRGREFNYFLIKKGFLKILFGFVEKVLIADCLVKIVDRVFSYYQVLHSSILIMGAIVYALYLYFDFAGYSNIAIGAANVLGFQIDINFNMPYCSETVKDFWHRWHISFSSWLKEYVYIVLGGNRKGELRKYCNLIMTFLISGMWHGFGLQFLFWGSLHGSYQIIEELCRKSNIPILNNRLVNQIRTFILVDIAWIFFRSATLVEGFRYVYCILFNWKISLRGFGIGFFELDYVHFAICIFIGVSILILENCIYREIIPGDLFERTSSRITYVSSIVLFFLIVLILFRNLGAPALAFVYSQF